VDNQPAALFGQARAALSVLSVLRMEKRGMEIKAIADQRLLIATRKAKEALEGA
jgi:hypothetical protein